MDTSYNSPGITVPRKSVLVGFVTAALAFELLMIVFVGWAV